MTKTLVALIAILFTACCVTSGPAQAADSPLAGKVIVIDPGHQLGNSNPKFAKYMAQTKFNGTIRKGCNTTGTATNSGLPEATFTWRVAKELRSMLESKGAKVIFTRDSNSYDDWGPCTWDRARAGARAGADLMISIHADGSSSKGKGFHVIAPARINGYTDDIYRPSRRLASDLIAGMKSAGAEPSNYIDGGLMVSSIMTTLNLSDVPSAIVELGNMRNSAEAKKMSSSSGQREYANWLLAGIQNYFARNST